MSMEAVGLLMVCTAVVLGCRVMKVPATLPLLAVVLAMIQVGALQVALVPGLAQLAAAKTELEHWTDERTEAGKAAVNGAQSPSELGGDVSQAP